MSTLFQEYIQKIDRFFPCEVGAYPSSKKGVIWVCEREKGSLLFSSEAISREIQKCMNAGIRMLEIVIGGPDGFSVQELDRMNPALRWSFGPMTFPHELAAVVATEQIYRAMTILKKLPYHCAH